jgi:hypothetical protein
LTIPDFFKRFWLSVVSYPLEEGRGRGEEGEVVGRSWELKVGRAETWSWQLGAWAEIWERRAERWGAGSWDQGSGSGNEYWKNTKVARERKASRRGERKEQEDILKS